MASVQSEDSKAKTRTNLLVPSADRSLQESIYRNQHFRRLSWFIYILQRFKRIIYIFDWFTDASLVIFNMNEVLEIEVTKVTVNIKLKYVEFIDLSWLSQGLDVFLFNMVLIN